MNTLFLAALLASTTLAAGRDLNLGVVTESTSHHIVWDANNQRSDASRTDIRLQAGGDINAKAANVSSAQGAVLATAGGSVKLSAGQATVQVDETHQQTSKGLFSSKTTRNHDTLDQSSALGSTFSGNTTTVLANQDIQVQGSNVVSTQGTLLAAQNNITIEAAKNTKVESHLKEEKLSGLFGTGGIGFTVGTRQQSVNQDGITGTAAASTVGSLEGNVSLQAGKNYSQVGSQVIAPQGNIDIAAQKVNIEEARDTSQNETETKFKQSGLTLALTSPVITALQTAQQMKQASSQTSDSRMQLLAGASTAMAGLNAYGAVQAGQGSTINGKANQIATGVDADNKPTSRDANAADQVGGINLSISIGGSKSQSNTIQTSNNAAGSTVAAGGDISIRASGAGQNSDLTVQGSSIKAGNNVSLQADDQINLLAAQSTADQHSTNKSISGSIGFSVGTGGMGITVSASGARGNADGSDVTQANTHVEAGQQLSINSGGDTTLKGAVAKATQVNADIGGNLHIESLQDTSKFDSKQKSIGGSVTMGAGVSGSLSASKSKVNSDFASVTEQSGIQAGDGGFNVNVRGNTDLKGGAITSTDSAVQGGKNSFATGGVLTTSDIQNHASYSAKSVGINVGSGFDAGGKLAPSGTSAGFGSDSGNASSTTQAAISGIAGNKDARTGDVEVGIHKIFDADKVQKDIDAQVQITQTFGREAPKAVAKFADDQIKTLKAQAQAAIEAGHPEQAQALIAEAQRWDEGGIYRVAAHTATGALSGGVEGALGAGAVARAAPLIDKLQDSIATSLLEAGASDKVAKAAGQLIAGATATGLGAVASGGSTAGAAMGLNIDANNRQLHPTQVQRVKELAHGDPQQEARLAAAACALAHCADGVPKSDPSYVYLKALQDAGSGLTPEKTLLGEQLNWDGQSYKPLFQYSVADEYIIDPFTQNKMAPRLAGAAQAGLSAAALTGEGLACTTGIGCAVALTTGTVVVDYGVAGLKQAITGNTAQPYGEQVLQSLGMSPEAAAYTYAVLGIAPAAIDVAIASKAANVAEKSNNLARISYEPIERFGARGVQATDTVMSSPQAQAMVNEYTAAGVATKDAVEYTKNLLSTSKNIPQEILASSDTALIKLVPRNAVGGDRVGDYSPFFVTREQYNELLKLPPSKIADALGLPAEQAIRGSQLGFDAYAMTPKLGVTPKVFASEVAPVEQGRYTASGGAQQIFVPNRSQWTDPNMNKIGEIKGGG